MVKIYIETMSVVGLSVSYCSNVILFKVQPVISGLKWRPDDPEKSEYHKVRKTSRPVLNFLTITTAKLTKQTVNLSRKYRIRVARQTAGNGNWECTMNTAYSLL